MEYSVERVLRYPGVTLADYCLEIFFRVARFLDQESVFCERKRRVTVPTWAVGLSIDHYAFFFFSLKSVGVFGWLTNDVLTVQSSLK